MTTDEAMRRSDENFSAWADFKESEWTSPSRVP